MFVLGQGVIGKYNPSSAVAAAAAQHDTTQAAASDRAAQTAWAAGASALPAAGTPITETTNAAAPSPYHCRAERLAVV